MPRPNVNAPADSLELKLELPREADAGSRMAAVLRVRNLGDRPIDLYLRGRTFTVDVIAQRTDGDTLWRRLDGEIIPAMIHHQRLVPKRSIAIPVAWTWTLGTGEYQLQALLLTEGEPLPSNRVSLRLR
jgi:hypothetical protein